MLIKHALCDISLKFCEHGKDVTAHVYKFLLCNTYYIRIKNIYLPLAYYIVNLLQNIFEEKSHLVFYLSI